MSNVSRKRKISLFSQFLPWECLFLWIFLGITAPWTIITFAGIKTPIFDWLEKFMSSFTPDKLETEFSLPQIPLHIILLVTIGTVISLGLFILIQDRYTKNWFIAADRKNLYEEISFNQSFLNLTKWICYRVLYVVYPVLSMTIISFVLMFVSINFFNIIAKLMGMNLELVLIVGIFVALLVGFLWLFAIAITGWNLITTIYGNVIAVTERKISNNLISKRSRRFAFLTMDAIIAYIFYVVLIAAVFLEAVYLFVFPENFSISNIIKLVIVEIINIAIFVILGRSITRLYYKSMLIQYAKISVKKPANTSGKNDLFTNNSDKFSISTI